MLFLTLYLKVTTVQLQMSTVYMMLFIYLHCAACVCVKCGPNLKPFLPQLQMTFTKALNDVNRSVRLRAADALGKLVVIHTRVDPLFVELVAALKAADDTSIRYLFLSTLCILFAARNTAEDTTNKMTIYFLFTIVVAAFEAALCTYIRLNI